MGRCELCCWTWLSLGLIVLLAGAGLAMGPASWPMFQGDPGHTGWDGQPYTEQPDVLWTATLEPPVQTSPVVVDGLVLAGTVDGRFHAVDLDTGAPIWDRNLGTRVQGSPVVGDGLVYIGTSDGHLQALNVSDGTPVWHVDHDRGIESTPALGDDLLFVQDTGGWVQALDRTTGQVAWELPLTPTATVLETPWPKPSPVLVDGTLFASTMDGRVVAVDAQTGVARWTFHLMANLPVMYDVEDHVASTPAVADGVVYVMASSSRIWALGAGSGVPIWDRYLWSTGNYAAPSVSDGTVYVGGPSNRNLTALDASTGQVLWSQDVRMVQASPAVTSDHVIVPVPGSLALLDAGTGAEVGQLHVDGSAVQSAPLVAQGNMFVGSDGGQLVAFGTDASDPPESPERPNETPLLPGPGLLSFLSASAAVARSAERHHAPPAAHPDTPNA